MKSPIVRTLGSIGLANYRLTRTEMSLEPTDEEASHILAPGFVDMHIHGAYGVDFMTDPPAELRMMANRLRQDGYEAMLPTTITSSFTETMAAINKCAADEMFRGFHLEGPFLSPLHPGAQPPSAILPIPTGPSEWDAVFDHPDLRQITLAPEQAGADALIGRLTARGVIVSMGHTDATYSQVESAVDLGASQTTHTYNAMRGLHHREPGAVGAALTDDRIYTELIYDRIHVSKPAADTLIRCKPADHLVAISDATMAAGMPTGSRFQMWGMDVVTGVKEVRLLNGTLAGSAITLLDAFQNLTEDFGLEIAIRACCLNPRRRLGIPTRRWNLFDLRLKIVDQFFQPPSSVPI